MNFYLQGLILFFAQPHEFYSQGLVLFSGTATWLWTISNDYYYDVQLPINHVISKTVLHLVVICITSHKHSKHMLKVCRKFSKKI